MEIFTSVQSLQNFLTDYRKRHNNSKIGFVPTMGALHEGHMSLIKNAVEKTDFIVASIFVNPTQFNSENDLKTYPRSIEKDQKLLEERGCNVLFLPEVDDIYTDDFSADAYEIEFDGIDEVMEGFYRPGHFKGVAMVVERFFQIVKPDLAFFGRKDFQQVAIIRQMIKYKNVDVEIYVVPTKRSEEGLALSSRNQLLSEIELKNALILNKTLKTLKEKFDLLSLKELEVLGKKMIEESPLELEYLSVVNDQTLEFPEDKGEKITCCIAAYCGEVRLIDNMPLNYDL